ncbi:MAG: hypothetical protein ACKV22_41590 [Bryobacteraceae bacterium]
MFKQTVALVLSLAMFTTNMSAGIDSDKAAYRGGTLPIKIGTEAKVDLTYPASLVFQVKNSPVVIPYEKVQSIEYGQKAGRRIGAAVGWTIVAGPLGLLALASKKRKHMVSVMWAGANSKSEAAVFEFGKDAIRPALLVLETRTGKQIEYESEEAKANIGK